MRRGRAPGTRRGRGGASPEGPVEAGALAGVAGALALLLHDEEQGVAVAVVGGRSARTGGRRTCRPCATPPGGCGTRTRCGPRRGVIRRVSAFIHAIISTVAGALLLHDGRHEAVVVVLHERPAAPRWRRWGWRRASGHRTRRRSHCPKPVRLVPCRTAPSDARTGGALDARGRRARRRARRRAASCPRCSSRSRPPRAAGRSTSRRPASPGDVPLVDQISGRADEGYNCGLAVVGYNSLGGRGGNANMAWAGRLRLRRRRRRRRGRRAATPPTRARLDPPRLRGRRDRRDAPHGRRAGPVASS